VIIDSLDVQFLAIAYVFARVRHDQILLLSVGKTHTVVLADDKEIVEENLVFFFLIGLAAEIDDKGPPVSFDFLKNSSEQDNTLILMHLPVEVAKVGVQRNSCPTSVMFTCDDPLVCDFVLTEIQTFCRMTYRADSHLEIFIRKYTISIHIKFFKKFVEFFIRNVHSPVLKVKSEIMRVNFSCLV
jgi:hypothetical protein